MLKAAARTMVLETRVRHIPTLGHVAELAAVLSGIGSETGFGGEELVGTINYEEYTRVGDALRDDYSAMADMLTPELMIALPRDAGGRVLKQSVLLRVSTQVVLERARADIAAYDSAATGWLTEADLETFLEDIKQEVAGASELNSGFFPFYVHTAVRAVLFTLDRTGSGRVALDTLAGSQLFARFVVLWQGPLALPPEGTDAAAEAPEVRAARWAMGEGMAAGIPGSAGAENWFSVENCVRLYRTYLSLDDDKDGLLWPRELCQLNNGSISRRFVDRVFQERYTFSGQLDFRGFLDLSMAFELKKEPQAVRFLFRILDRSGEGRLAVDDVQWYLDEVGERLGAITQDRIGTRDLLTEWMDMVGPADRRYVSLSDIQRCTLGHTALRVLTDVQALWAFDNRESLAHDKPAEDDD